MPGGGVQARLPENNSDNVFSPQLILQFYSGVYQWFISKLLFSKVSEGVRGANISMGSQMLMSIETLRTYDFPGDGGHFIASDNIKVLGEILHP